MLIGGDAVKRHRINFSHENFANSEPLLKRLMFLKNHRLVHSL